MKARITFVEELLGTCSADPEVHEKFIASKSADKDKVKEEVANLPAEELIEKSVTVFPHDENGNPFLYDYQVRGFIKEALGIQVEFKDIIIPAQTKIVIDKNGKERTVKHGKERKISWFTHKRIVDNYIFVSPRVISLHMPEGGEITHCTRPLRADTMKGARVALATSEAIPAGTFIEIEIDVTNEQLMPFVIKCLDFGCRKGIGQWRNSGKGRFQWEEI
jgi:hypothetical protein